jgi:hypothetical protein
MATRIPLVLVNGKIQRLQSSDQITVNTAYTQIRTRTNTNGSSIVIGGPVYQSTTAEEVKYARANAESTSQVYGLVYDTSISDTATGSIATDGPLVATTGQWDTITGQTGGLTPGSTYYLSAATAGRLTTTAPDTAGQTVCKVGTAVSTTEMEINIESYILL